MLTLISDMDHDSFEREFINVTFVQERRFVFQSTTPTVLVPVSGCFGAPFTLDLYLYICTYVHNMFLAEPLMSFK